MSNNYSITATNAKPILQINSQSSTSLEVHGDIRVTGKIFTSEKNDLLDRLECIETLLGIPPRNLTLETKYPELKELYQEYFNELELTIKKKNLRLTKLLQKYMLKLEEYKTWDIIQK